MRILFWSDMFWPYIGGTEIWAARFLSALRERGHELIVVTRRGDLDLPEEAHYKGIPLYRFPFRQALADGDIDQVMEIRQQVVRLKRSFTPDLVHISGLAFSAIFHLDTVHAHPAPLLVTLHGETYEPVQKQNTLLEQALSAADWITAPSAGTLEYARQLVPGFVPRSSVIHYGLRAPTLSPGPLPFDPPRLLCLGRLVALKGFDVALTAFASIVARYPRARLVIAGDGPERVKLERQAAELELQDAVEFTGWVAPDGVPSLLSTATLVLIPSDTEGLPLVALEAASMARPVIATRVGGLPEAVVHEQTGLLVEPRDSNALAEAIAFLLDHRETAMEMGQAARQRAEEVLGFERDIDAYESLYRRLVADWHNGQLHPTSPS